MNYWHTKFFVFDVLMIIFKAVEKIMQTHIVYRRELFAWAIGYLIVCLGAEIVLIEVVKSTAISLVGLMAMVLPLALMPLLLRVFTRDVNVDLSPDQFRFEIMNKKGPEEKIIKLSEIESYSIQFPTNKINCIRFNLTDGRSLEFSFLKHRKDVSVVDSVELIERFRSAIGEYNSGKAVVRKILLSPSFYASTKGLYCIIGLCVFLVAAILLAFYKGKSVPLAFLFSLILVSQLISKRWKELQYNKSKF